MRGDSLTSTPSAGDTIVTESRVIEVRVAELRQLFNAIDPSPFRERDLDPDAEQFIVEWARDLPRDAPLALRVQLERCAGRADEATLLRQAIHQYFTARAAGSRRTLRELFQRGRISLLIALAFLGASLVRIEYNETVSDGAWRSDWPATPTARLAGAQQRAHMESRSVRRSEVPLENPEHQHTAEEERTIREAALDQTIAASFPASDPPSSNPNPDDHAALERSQDKSNVPGNGR